MLALAVPPTAGGGSHRHRTSDPDGAMDNNRARPSEWHHGRVFIRSVYIYDAFSHASSSSSSLPDVLPLPLPCTCDKGTAG